jgi:hypothetical protein
MSSFDEVMSLVVELTDPLSHDVREKHKQNSNNKNFTEYVLFKGKGQDRFDSVIIISSKKIDNYR